MVKTFGGTVKKNSRKSDKKMGGEGGTKPWRIGALEVENGSKPSTVAVTGRSGKKKGGEKKSGVTEVENGSKTSTVAVEGRSGKKKGGGGGGKKGGVTEGKKTGGFVHTRRYGGYFVFDWMNQIPAAPYELGLRIPILVTGFHAPGMLLCFNFHIIL